MKKAKLFEKMVIVGSMPDGEEDKVELMSVAKIFLVGQRVQQLSQEARRKNEDNNKKKGK